jgi:E3 ubiquitin-protein ligase TRIP12
LNSIEQFLWPKVSTSTSDQDTESSPSSVASESKYAEDDPQERDSSPDSSPPSEVLFCFAILLNMNIVY